MVPPKHANHDPRTGTTHLGSLLLQETTENDVDFSPSMTPWQLKAGALPPEAPHKDTKPPQTPHPTFRQPPFTLNHPEKA